MTLLRGVLVALPLSLLACGRPAASSPPDPPAAVAPSAPAVAAPSRPAAPALPVLQVAEPEEVEPEEVPEPEEPVEHVEQPEPAAPVIAQAPPPAEQPYVPTSADLVLLQEAVKFFDELVAAVETNAQSCDGMAESLQSLFGRNQQLISRAKEITGNPPREQWFKEQAEKTMMASVERMMAPLQNCATNPKLQAAFQSLAD